MRLNSLNITVVFMITCLTIFVLPQAATATGLTNYNDQLTLHMMKQNSNVGQAPTPNMLRVEALRKSKPKPLPPKTQPSTQPQIVQTPIEPSFTFPVDYEYKTNDYKADSNSPVLWEDGEMILFNSAGAPWRSTGPDMRQMSQPHPVVFNNIVNGGRWMEAVVRDDETGFYYGYYHNEPIGDCSQNNKTAPKIGAAVSKDQGRSWTDLGIILEAMGLNNCNTSNHYFIGGHGDFSVMLDHKKENLYFFFSSYEDEWDQQGIGAAVMEWKDRNQPAGNVWKYWGPRGQQKSFSQPGLKGAMSALDEDKFGIKASWHDPIVDAFWGPSIHFNSYLNQYVMLLNHAIKSNYTFQQEGIYVSYSPTLDDPTQWTKPERIVEGGVWYPQIIGNEIGKGTDKESGCEATFFVGGIARSTFKFIRPGQVTPCQ